MPNGGHNVLPEDLGTYRKSEVAELQASHNALLAAAELLLASLTPSRTCSSQALRALRTAVAKAKPNRDD